MTGLEVDERQHAKNLAAAPQRGLHFIAAGAQAVAQAIPIAEASFDLALMLKSLHHVPRPLLAQGRFEMPVHFHDFADFEQRMMRPTFADHRIDDAKLAGVRAVFEPHLGADGARFARPMHVRLLRRRA